MFRFSAVLIFVLAASMAAAQKPAEWNQWKGPLSNGHSPCAGLIESFPEGGPKLLWKVDNLGEGYSDLSFFGNQIFTMGDAGGQCFVIALNRKTGKENWRTPIGKAGGNYPGPRCTPACDGQTVFAMGQFADWVALDAKNGKEIWHRNVEKDLGGKVMSGWNFSMSPILDGKQIVIPIGGDGGTLAAFDKKGNLVWRSTELKDPAGYTSAVPVEIGGVRQFLVLTEKSIAGISPKDGKLLWLADFPGKVAVCSDPVVRGDVVFAACAYGVGAVGYKISKNGNAFKAEEIYADKKLENHHGGIITVGDHFYLLTNNRLVCVEPKSGKIVWEDKSVGKGSMIFADGKLILRSEKGEGTVAMADATPEGYKERGRFDQPDRSDKNSWTYPLVVDDRLFLRDQNVLLCYEMKP